MVVSSLWVAALGISLVPSLWVSALGISLVSSLRVSTLLRVTLITSALLRITWISRTYLTTLISRSATYRRSEILLLVNCTLFAMHMYTLPNIWSGSSFASRNLRVEVAAFAGCTRGAIWIQWGICGMGVVTNMTG